MSNRQSIVVCSMTFFIRAETYPHSNYQKATLGDSLLLQTPYATTEARRRKSQFTLKERAEKLKRRQKLLISQNRSAYQDVEALPQYPVLLGRG